MRNRLRKGCTSVLLLLLCLPLSAAAQESAALRLPLQPGHTHDILRVEWSPGDRLLASYSAGDGSLKVWDVESARLLWSARTEFVRRKDEYTNIVGVVWSPDLSMLAVANANGAVMLWDVSAGRLRWVQRDAHKSDGLGVAFSADGRFVVSAAVPDGKREVKVWEAASGAPAALERGGAAVSSLAAKATSEVVHNPAISGDGRLSAEGGHWGDTSIKITEAASGKLYRVLEGHPGIVHALAFSPDGLRVVSGSGDRLVRLWDARTGGLLAAFEGHMRAVLAVAFSPDGKLIASTAKDRTLRVWDSVSGATLKVIKVEDDGIWSYEAVAFSPDGRLLASGGENQNVVVWDTDTGAALWSLLPLKREEDPLAKSTAPTFFELKDERERLTREADKETAAWAGRVNIAFEHFGEPSDPWQARMVETGEPSKSKSPAPESSARGIWLRLRNNAPLPISFRTYGVYTGKCGPATEPARRFGLLCEGMEVGAAYNILNAKGESRAPNEIDVFATATLPPGTSVLFSVPREHLSRGLSVCLEYTYVKEDEKHTLKDYGSARSVCFKAVKHKP